MKMHHDDVAWDRCDELLEEFKTKVSSPDILRAVTEFMKSHRPNTKATDRARIIGMGAFNLCFRMEFEDGFASLLRFPCHGHVAFPEKKVRNEVAIMAYLKKHTKIPVPGVISYGMKGQSPGGLGPFILMEYIANASNLTAQLRAPGYQRGDRPFQDPIIEESKLEFFYGQLADILLELSKPCFERIGSMEIDTWAIDSRPLTMNMNELVQLGNFPPTMLPQSSFATASSYYKSLAKTEFLHLQTQRNDAVESQEDCYSKYIARKLVYGLAEESRLLDISNETGPFKLFCDDLRPSNILLDDDMKIIAVIDWEFTYAAPREYTFSPPWWLLLEMPEEWPQGVLDWKEKYQPRLETFLQVLKSREDSAIASGDLVEDQRLSGKMWQSWTSGDFWVHYGLRKSWAFDAVWPMMDARLFGGDTPLEDRDKLLCTERLDFLSAEDKKAMEPFAQEKLEQMKLRRLDIWDNI
ncbi:phosphotransferase enzyme family protein [Aspergillus sclerotiicarbonarius CBS 121057]|uniref:Phosphotransferase enzyme family protein n=1 Tax=Aspergillus sclerotiicarbonarius (strain CBS 121057 / IBT 28362) TaxID=1448318 RepID=A0A319DV79_ASPSB|nr:phosphotransferase enzyme family protein [Aspergillus sclerotiicarbonarius CBS 121057]